VNNLPNFHLNRTVNELGNAVLRKLQTRKIGGAWRHETSARQYLLRENTKNIVFCEQNTTLITWRHLSIARRCLTKTHVLTWVA